jgi:hypothetical protein
MNRRAILLAAASKNTSFSRVAADVENFRAFLKSNIGGAWNDSEVALRMNPTRDQIISAVQSATDSTYCMVFFAGSGKKVKKKLPWFEMELSLNSGEIVSERELNSGSARCTLILDGSASVSAGRPEDVLEVPSILRGQDQESAEYRAHYDRSLAEAESGLVRVYVTRQEYSAASKQSFAQLLFEESCNWAMQKMGVLSVGEAVALAGDAVRLKSGSLRIEYLGGRRLHDFPFAIRHEFHR